MTRHCQAVVQLDADVYVACERLEGHDDAHQSVEHADPIPHDPAHPLATVEVRLSWST